MRGRRLAWHRFRQARLQFLKEAGTSIDAQSQGVAARPRGRGVLMSSDPARNYYQKPKSDACNEHD